MRSRLTRVLRRLTRKEIGYVTPDYSCDKNILPEVHHIDYVFNSGVWRRDVVFRPASTARVKLAGMLPQRNWMNLWH